MANPLRKQPQKTQIVPERYLERLVKVCKKQGLSRDQAKAVITASFVLFNHLTDLRKEAKNG